MAILAGIDEAGYGPVLGPLVVSASVLELPEAAAGANLWRLLAGAVTRRALRKSPALPLADSKAMHVRRDGLVHLERGVLGMLAQTGPAPRSLTQLLRRLARQALTDAGEYPWYAGADLPLPRQADPADVALRANGAAEAMARRGLRLCAVRSEVVLAGQYNRLVAATRNKAVALFGVASRLIAYVFQTYGAAGGETVRIVADRQGGRIRYRAGVQRMFQHAAIKVLREDADHSAYFVQQGRRCAEIHFLTDGEDACLPVALASMVSKYLRELFMELLNDYWSKRVQGLKPTAGYYKDGRRFLNDIAEALAAAGADTSLLVRSR